MSVLLPEIQKYEVNLHPQRCPSTLYHQRSHFSHYWKINAPFVQRMNRAVTVITLNHPYTFSLLSNKLVHSYEEVHWSEQVMAGTGLRVSDRCMWPFKTPFVMQHKKNTVSIISSHHCPQTTQLKNKHTFYHLMTVNKLLINYNTLL